jgi:flagellar biosynthesis protein FlhA
VVDTSTVVATHLTEVIRLHAHEFLTRQSVAKLVEGVKKESPAVVDEIIPSQLTLGDLQKILQNLLKEHLPIRDMESILEGVADHIRETKDVQLLTEYARRALSRSITKLAPSSRWEDLRIDVGTAPRENHHGFGDRLESGQTSAMDPRLVQKMFRSLSTGIEKMVGGSRQPLVLCSPQVRPYFKKLVERYIPHLTVLSYNELMPRTEIQSMGLIEVAHEN